MKIIFPVVLLCWSAAALAQTPPAPAEQPALQGVQQIQQASKPAAKPPPRQEEGTTIIGEQESPIGLFITPWRNAHAEKDIDRPARLLQEELLPIDQGVFVRQLEYYEALSGALRGKNVVTPPVQLAPAPPPASPP